MSEEQPDDLERQIERATEDEPSKPDAAPDSTREAVESGDSSPTEEPTRPVDGWREDGSIRTNRTRGLEVVAASILALAVLVGSGEAFLLAIPLALAIIYHRSTTLPDVELEATREFSQVSAVPGDTVTVVVTVKNTGESTVPDLRVRDVVPDRLPVVGGSTMGAFSLEPAESVTVSYDVIARRGRHDFERVEVVCRNTSGSERRLHVLDAPRTLVAEVELDTIPLAARATQYTGRLETAVQGGGVEFHSTREYHPSDSPRDIDWRRYAKTGEFTTIEYRDARAASIHLVVDRRAATQEQVGPDGVTSREMCLYAAEHVAQTLIEDGHEIGLTAVGDPIVTHYPGKNPRQYRRIRRVFKDGQERADEREKSVSAGRTADSKTDDTSEAPSIRSDGGRIGTETADDLVAQTASHTQFVCVTGLYDVALEDVLVRLAEHKRSVLVIAPRHDMVETPGSTLSTLQREIRIDKLRREGIRVLDWDTDEPLKLAIERRVGGLWE